MRPEQAEELVEKIVQDPAAYRWLRARLASETDERLDELAESVAAKNLPVLGTGGTE
jgi:hypothetical protein